MGKYYLVASYYDGKGSFYNEKIIKMEGVKLDTLGSIDSYTSNKLSDELWSDISKENDLSNCNLLSIRYLKNDRSKPSYYKIICSNPIINSCANDLQLKVGKDRKRSYFINKKNKFFQVELNELDFLINEGDIEQIKEIIGDNSHLVFLIKRYIDNINIYEDYDEKKVAYDDIVAEFSKYINFRRWVVGSNKKVYSKGSTFSDKAIQKPKYNYKYKKHDKSWNLYDDLRTDRQSVLDRYNTRDLEKEEFLEDSELDQMGYSVDSVIADIIKEKEDVKRRIKKKVNKLSYEEEDW